METKSPRSAKIRMRDGTRLSADIYMPPHVEGPSPVILHLTPYGGKNSGHDAGVFFSKNNYIFVRVSCRGCEASEGTFELFSQDGRDGFDSVRWLSDQAWCNGQVAMWGGSYCGFTQWATAAEFPPNLAAIAPVASCGIVWDYPMTNNIFMCHSAFYCIFVDRAATRRESIDGRPFSWREVYYKRFMEHLPFDSLDSLAGYPSEIFQNLIRHPTLDSHWSSVLPGESDYQKINIPILTITGHYDGDQRGALMYARNHQEYGMHDAIARHDVVIGPWNHTGSCTQPTRYLAGLDFGESCEIDLLDLHLQWYDWALKGSERPSFLRKRVAYFVEGSNRWKSADNLCDLENARVRYYLASPDGEASLARPGNLSVDSHSAPLPVEFVYDPLDTSPAAFERDHETVYHSDSSHAQRFLVDQSPILAHILKQNGVVYQSEPFEHDIEMIGNMRLVVWLSMDVPDTDFQVCIYEIKNDQRSIILTDAMMRARYRDSLTTQSLVVPGEVSRYEFDQFQFFARQIRKGSRLRLVFQCVNSIYWQKNYNSGGAVAQETVKDARTAHVTVHQSSSYPSFLEVPIVE